MVVGLGVWDIGYVGFNVFDCFRISVGFYLIVIFVGSVKRVMNCLVSVWFFLKFNNFVVLVFVNGYLR